VDLVHLTLLACAVVAAVLVVRYDLYEREPWPMLLGAASAGGVVMWTMGFLEDATLARCGGPAAGPAVLAAIAAVEEELARLAVVALIAWVLPGQLNDPIDGLIYGSIVGLGMAVEESREVLSWMRPVWLLPPTEPVRLLGHLVLGGITGFAVGMARHAVPVWKIVLGQCVAISIGIHFVWDWIAFIVRGHDTCADTRRDGLDDRRHGDLRRARRARLTAFARAVRPRFAARSVGLAVRAREDDGRAGARSLIGSIDSSARSSV
jgi:RsiW-degrading membrane proteinase PrsW (M82 family)